MSNEHPRILLYILRRDIRLSDNPIFDFASRQLEQSKTRTVPSDLDTRHHEISLTSKHDSAKFTHLLPLYIFSANQIEVSGFLSSSSDTCPYPEARSYVAGVWRTGPHRAKFVAEGVWDLKQNLESLGCGSGLVMRAGTVDDVVSDILDWYSKGDVGKEENAKVTGIYMTNEDGPEELDDMNIVKKIAEKHNVDFEVWEDEKYFVDECVVPSAALSLRRVAEVNSC